MRRNVLHGGNGSPRIARLKPLAAAFVAVFAWTAQQAHAAMWTVDTANGHCGDGGGASGQGDLTTIERHSSFRHLLRGFERYGQCFMQRYHVDARVPSTSRSRI